MATVREGNTPVLVVVDVQAGAMADAWEAARTIRNVARVVERARAEGVPVIWVQHGDDDLPQGTPPWQWVPELVPAELDRGYDLTLVDDAHTTGTMRLESGVILKASNIVQELNIAMTWLAYPGRKNGTASAEQVRFAIPGGKP